MSADDGRSPSQKPKTSSNSADSFIHQFLSADHGLLMVIRETLVSVAAVVLIGMLLFAISGVWPPMVAVESGSMEPHMYRGDLVFITAPDRFAPDSDFQDTGVVPYRQARETGYRKFGDYGTVVVYDSPDTTGSPVIHRARFWVEEGENWYGEANESYVVADSCAELRNCPAPNRGFITKGDHNSRYDQASGISRPVKPEWVTGTARVRIPYLGWIRLAFANAAARQPLWMAGNGTVVESPNVQPA